MAFGDPHFRTFDGVEYMFNGRGEFWLLRDHFNNMDDVSIQGRFQQPPNDSGTTSETL